MLGKLRLALSPSQPNWMFTALHLSPRGVTTGSLPWRESSIEAYLDVFLSELVVQRSNGQVIRIALLPIRTIADIYASFLAALDQLEVECTFSPIPQELADVTPFHLDRRTSAYDPVAVRTWFAAATAASNIFDTWRAHFFGRTGVQLWWGAFDVAVILFNGRHAEPPLDRGYIMKYDLDAELMNAGLYFGDENTAPFFYGYIFPEPPEARSLPINPPAASWSETLGEWVLPYERVRVSEDPAGDVRVFLTSIYAHCVNVANWDRDLHRYEAPK